jgi:protein involved in polysaccharide export with SLBB domain
MKFSIRHCDYAVVAVVTAAAATPFAPLAAQATREFETRAQLEAAAQEATAARKDAEAYRIRLRLSEGDFYPGDRIVVRIDGPAPFTDTITVAAGKKIALPQMGDFSLAGVLRSELRSKLQAHVSTFIRNSEVQVKPLVRIAVLGSVSQPGFYYTSADVPLTDVVMGAGGPSSEADMAKVDIRRGTEVLFDKNNTRRAISEGMSLDMLHLKAGDEIHVGAKRNVSLFTTVLPAVASLAGIIVGLLALR